MELCGFTDIKTGLLALLWCLMVSLSLVFCAARHQWQCNPLTSLGDYLDPELISRCLAEAGTVTLRKRHLPLEMMVWCIVGIAP